MALSDLTVYAKIFGELGGIVLIILALGVAFATWRKNRNPIDLGTLFLFVTVAVAIIYTGVRASLMDLGIIDSSVFIKIGLLDLGDLMTVLMASAFVWFVVYIYQLKIIYSLPLVTGFFFSAYGILTNDMPPILTYVTWTMLPATLVLFINAIKNKQGLSFSLAILAVAAVLIAVMNPASIFAYIIKWFTGINIILGQNGWWDDHVFFDRKKRKQIQNVWIARMTTAA
ncbi:MAG: hypothetical protein ACTSYI_05905 [Promethearchaeota archaeon]